MTWWHEVVLSVLVTAVPEYGTNHANSDECPTQSSLHGVCQALLPGNSVFLQKTGYDVSSILPPVTAYTVHVQ